MRVAWLLLVIGCANPLLGLQARRVVALDHSEIVIRWSTEDDSQHARIEWAATRAAHELDRWGGLQSPVTLNVLPSHAALEQITGRYGYGWLLAWGQYDNVSLQSPRTWRPPPRDEDVAEWLTHELTHCLMFQDSATPSTWAEKEIPLWFREGMATVTARQGYRYETLESLATWQLAHPDLDIFTEGEALSEKAFDQVYGISYHAMTFFIRRYGDVAVLGTMRNMKEGDFFPAAFTKAIGITPVAFAREFQNYLRLRGFRGFGLPVHRPILQ